MRSARRVRSAGGEAEKEHKTDATRQQRSDANEEAVCQRVTLRAASPDRENRRLSSGRRSFRSIRPSHTPCGRPFSAADRAGGGAKLDAGAVDERRNGASKATTTKRHGSPGDARAQRAAAAHGRRLAPAAVVHQEVAVGQLVHAGADQREEVELVGVGRVAPIHASPGNGRPVARRRPLLDLDVALLRRFNTHRESAACRTARAGESTDSSSRLSDASQFVAALSHVCVIRSFTMMRMTYVAVTVVQRQFKLFNSLERERRLMLISSARSLPTKIRSVLFATVVRYFGAVKEKQGDIF